MAVNRWSNSGADLDVGIGNRLTSHPDWTFAANAASYGIKRLYVLIQGCNDPCQNDTTPPTVSCPQLGSAAAGPNCSTVVPAVGVTASDNCTPANQLIVTQSPAAGTVVGLGTHPITVTVTDASGNSAQCQTTLAVIPGPSFCQPVPDVFPGTPFLTCILGNFQEPSRIQNWRLRLRSSATETVVLTVAATTVNPAETGAIEATVTDQNGAQSVTVIHPAAQGDNLGSLSLTLQGGNVYDLAIRRTGQAAHYKLGAPDKRLEISFAHPLLYLEHHEQAWVVNAAPNETVSIDVLKDSPAVGGADPQATSMTYSIRRPDCTEVVPSTTIPVSGAISFSAGPAGGAFVIFMQPNGHFALRKNSGCDGGFYALPCPPKLQIACPANIIKPNDPGQCGANVNYAATATGICSPTVTYSINPGSFFPVGTTPVTATATDLFGATATCSFTVTVLDTTPPTLTNPASGLTVECDGAGNAAQLNAWLAGHAGATAADGCGAVAWSHNFTGLSDGCGRTGAATVTFTATDEAGNSSTTQATFTIVDTTAPAVTVPAGNQIVECDGAGNVAQLQAWLDSHGGAAASDICGGVTWSHNFTALSDDCGKTGSAPVTFKATDACGNSSATTATFTIVDTTAPEITFTLDHTIPPAVLNGTYEIYPNDVPISFTVTAEDVCGASSVALSYTCTAINSQGKVIDRSGTCQVTINGGNVLISESGGVGNIFTITAVATDECGNMSEEELVIKVVRPANEGVGNGVDGNTPGHDNNGGNDDPGFTPGNPGAKSKPKP